MNLRSRWPVALVGLLLVLLPLLAALQYRWIGQVSAAEHDRLANSLRVSTARFADDFTGEIAGIFAALQVQGGFPASAGVILDRYRLLESTIAYPQLVRSLHIIKSDPLGPSTLYRVNPTSGDLEEEVWPDGWEPLTRLGREPPNLGAVTRILGFVSPIGPSNAPPRGQPPGRFGPPGPPNGGPPESWWLVELDRDVLVTVLLPSLAERHFGGHDQSDYRIAVLAGNGNPELVFTSEGTWTREDIATPDAFLDLSPPPQPAGPARPPNAQPPANPPPPFGDRGQPRLDNPSGPPGATVPPGPGGFQGPGGPPGPGAGPGLRRAVRPPLLPLGQPLRLVVKHRLGGLETAVDQVRQRNLAVSFGILLVLGAGLIALVVSTLRARALGKLQMDFAAGVSHEIRTPLAVIQSAAYNLQSGAVQDKKAIDEYAVILQYEARRLSDMVTQVLLFAETQSSPKKYELAPVDVAALIDRSIRNLSSGLRQGECEISSDIQADLPQVMADAAALTQCIQNLLSNAVKYAKVDGLVRIKVLASQDRDRREVQITVADEGPGIAASDRPRLFEPFYRGAHVGSNIPGNGLGLHLVKRLMESQRGRVTFNNNPGGKGAYFTLHIRTAGAP